MKDVAPSTTRRRLLAGAAAGITSGLAGCSEQLWTRAENTGPEQVSLTIKAVPSDDDLIAAKISSQLRENLQAIGIDAASEPVAESELYRDVLIEGEYDIFVARHPGLDEYDALRGLLHSRFVSERGWQNPFHFSDLVVDEALEAQLSTGGAAREETLVELFEYLEETPPYTAVAFPYQLGAATDEIEISDPPGSAVDYIDILTRQSGNDSRDGPLEVGVFGERLTERLNPIVVDRNGIDGLLDLVYDPLARPIDDEYVPWLAETVDWNDDGQLVAMVTLRDGLNWHDDTPLDADDVTFTYRFLQDTSLGEIEGGVPAPRYRSRQTLVEGVRAVDSRTVRFSFETTSRTVASRALSIPLLPEHIWEPRSTVVAERQTDALVTDNEGPIGSGLFAFRESTSDLEIELEAFDEHVLRSETTDRPAMLEDVSQFDGIRFQVSPNAGAMIDALIEGEIDLTASELPPGETSTILGASDISAVIGTSDAFYMIGYNSHHPELGNPHFRRILSRLIDREHAVAELFTGFGEPATTYSSVLGIRDADLEYDDRPIVSQFPGSDGELDVDRIRSLFEDEGYRYENGTLLE